MVTETQSLLTPRDRDRMKGVHPDLVRVVERARRSEVFIVGEGLRTAERQMQLYRAGASKTLNSRHLTGHAVDLIAVVDSQVRWDWPLYHRIAAAMKNAAKVEEVPIEWGGDWTSFPDGPHFQLPWAQYPHPAAPKSLP